MAMNNYSYLQETHDAGKHTTGFIEMIITAQHSEINRSITKQARKTSGTFVQLRRTPAVKRDSPTELNLTTDEDKECSLPPKQKWNKLHFDPGMVKFVDPLFVSSELSWLQEYKQLKLDSVVLQRRVAQLEALLNDNFIEIPLGKQDENSDFLAQQRTIQPEIFDWIADIGEVMNTQAIVTEIFADKEPALPLSVATNYFAELAPPIAMNVVQHYTVPEPPNAFTSTTLSVAPNYFAELLAPPIANYTVPKPLNAITSRTLSIAPNFFAEQALPIAVPVDDSPSIQLLSLPWKLKTNVKEKRKRQQFLPIAVIATTSYNFPMRRLRFQPSLVIN